MSTVKATNFQNASSATANMVTDASGNVSFGGTAAMSSSFLRNRVINGDMRIDQRNAGAAITPINAQYGVDRWLFSVSQASKLTSQQSSVAPTGFINSTLITSSSAYSVLAADAFWWGQRIEGLNVSDLGWGTASAKTVTVSFQVYSSLTGTFGGALANSAFNRSYPFTYTVSSANTWTSVSVTIAGDTSGTWLTTNGIGIQLMFSLGTGTTYSGTAGAWASTTYVSATGAVSVVGTSGATFYITGVQLEVGTVATPFERQLYNAQLAQCQRYLPAYRSEQNNWRLPGAAVCGATNQVFASVVFPVTTRVLPTGIVVSSAGNLSGGVDGIVANVVFSTLVFSSAASTQTGRILGTTATSPFTAGQSAEVEIASGGYLYFTGCEL